MSDQDSKQVLVRQEVRRLEVREAAAQVLRDRRAEALRPPTPVLLRDFLAVEDEPARYRVQGLWPVGGRIVLAAQYKAGKTTMRDNLVRALVDGEPFLGAYPVEPFAGTVVLFDNELDPRMLRRWLRDQAIRSDDRVVVVPLRGKVSSLDLLDPAVRAQWAAVLRQARASVIVLDCLRPVLDALGLSEDKDAGRFLVAFDALLVEAGASEAVIVHHMGHAGERSRGDTRLRDWPDVEWRLVREKGEDGEQDSNGRRYFAAYGRDVDQPEGLVEYDPQTRRLTLTGGTRQDTAADQVIPAVLEYLRGNPGASGRAVEAALTPAGHRQRHVRQALRRAVEQGAVDTTAGANRSTLHFLASTQCVSASGASAVRQRAPRGCVSASLGDAHARTRALGPAVRHDDALPADGDAAA